MPADHVAEATAMQCACMSHAHRVVLPKSLASERCDHFLVTHVQFFMPTTTAGVVGIHRMLRARF